MERLTIRDRIKRRFQRVGVTKRRIKLRGSIRENFARESIDERV